MAADEGVDTFITGEGPHWTYALAEELGINVLYGGHYATETFGVKALAAELSKSSKCRGGFLITRPAFEFLFCGPGKIFVGGAAVQKTAQVGTERFCQLRFSRQPVLGAFDDELEQAAIKHEKTSAGLF